MLLHVVPLKMSEFILVVPLYGAIFTSSGSVGVGSVAI